MLTQTPAQPIEEDNDPEAQPQPTVMANDEIVGQCHRSDSFRSCENSGRKRSPIRVRERTNRFEAEPR
jgi:hypothetical protein